MEAAAKIYLQVEAINLEQHVFDTTQLSVIRGSSLLLKRAIGAVARHFAKALEPLSVGASVGLFRVLEGGDDPLASAQQLCDEIAVYLNVSPPPRQPPAADEQPDFSAFTFVVVCCAAESLPLARTRLTALVRFRQLRQASVAPDRSDGFQGPGAARPCAVSPRRRAMPGECRNRFRAEGTTDSWVSRSVWRRRQHGRDARTGLYFDSDADCAELLAAVQADPDPSLGFTSDFETLATNPAFGNLDRKLAVLSFDGNDFSKRQSEYATGPKRQQAFDRTLRCLRGRLLRQLIGALARGRHVQATLEGATMTTAKGNCLRLETLLWGGDEATLVVPAWLGLDVLHLVFRLWRDLVDAPAAVGVLDALAGSTHAAGLVFCHHKTPIAEARRQAKRLVERVKQGATPDKDRDAFDYLVLESIDYPTEPDLDQFFATRYGPIARHRAPLTPDPNWWTTGQQQARELTGPRGLGRGGVFRLARALAGDARLLGGLHDPAAAAPPWARQPADPKPAPGGLAELEARAWRAMARAGAPVNDPTDTRTAADGLESFAATLGLNVQTPRERAWLWLHLAELWDYLSPVPKPAADLGKS